MLTKKLQILGNFLEVDSTLTQSGKAADAKSTGDAITKIQTNIDNITSIDYDTYLAFDTTEIV